MSYRGRRFLFGREGGEDRERPDDPEGLLTRKTD